MGVDFINLCLICFVSFFVGVKIRVWGVWLDCLYFVYYVICEDFNL